ncbi:ribonuclease M5 [Ornithinibacillus sp. BX22]|uniref:Ribonuclease M5 n=2 Tax=Ornithinibacillus TaxID=484508 RepID=A0A923L8M9_9BACI|nr:MULTISPECIES: ribonuclease M5 [Ornithinibacillus]MBC5638395.1 ribonuclease M5 [Ornithinibacillus hominis]MBS3678631.1 ribonuclease M5 [Ornithinibacillus massiliensis]
MKIKEIIIVEGKDDTTKIKLAVDADTIETNGSAINQKTIQQIKHAKEKRGVIIFTDPDYPGERIRHIIDQAVPGCKHAFLTQDNARAKHPNNKSLGIEHASVEVIRKALEDVYELADIEQTDITKEDLMNYRLIGGPGSSKRRERLGEILQVGHTNGKQLLKRLTMFQISKAQLEEAMEKIEQEDIHG